MLTKGLNDIVNQQSVLILAWVGLYMNEWKCKILHNKSQNWYNVGEVALKWINSNHRRYTLLRKQYFRLWVHCNLMLEKCPGLNHHFCSKFILFRTHISIVKLSVLQYKSNCQLSYRFFQRHCFSLNISIVVGKWKGQFNRK